MGTFLVSVAALVASASFGLGALESGDPVVAVLAFGAGALSAIVVARSFVRGVFAASVEDELGPPLNG